MSELAASRRGTSARVKSVHGSFAREALPAYNFNQVLLTTTSRDGIQSFPLPIFCLKVQHSRMKGKQVTLAHAQQLFAQERETVLVSPAACAVVVLHQRFGGAIRPSSLFFRAWHSGLLAAAC